MIGSRGRESFFVGKFIKDFFRSTVGRVVTVYALTRQNTFTVLTRPALMKRSMPCMSPLRNRSGMRN